MTLMRGILFLALVLCYVKTNPGSRATLESAIEWIWRGGSLKSTSGHGLVFLWESTTILTFSFRVTICRFIPPKRVQNSFIPEFQVPFHVLQWRRGGKLAAIPNFSHERGINKFYCMSVWLHIIVPGFGTLSDPFLSALWALQDIYSQ